MSTTCQLIPVDRHRKYYKTNVGLTVIPSNIPPDVVEVIITYNNLTKIEANVFLGLSQCTKLDLNHNEISEVEPEAFN